MKNYFCFYIIMDKTMTLFDLGIEIASFPIEVGYNYQFVCFDKLTEEQKKNVEEFRKNIKLLTCDELSTLDEAFRNYFELEKQESDSGVWYVLNSVYQRIKWLENQYE